jgi:hypothetical protein
MRSPRNSPTSPDRADVCCGGISAISERARARCGPAAAEAQIELLVEGVRDV